MGLAGLLVAIIVGIFTYLAWRQPSADRLLTLQIDSQIDTKLSQAGLSDLHSDVTAMKSRLDEVDSYLKILIGKQLNQTSKLSPTKIRDDLPEVAALLTAAKATATQAPSETVHELSSKLAQVNRNEPHFWSAATAMINFRSRTPSSSNLPKCFDAPPAGGMAARGQWIVDLVYRHCMVDLGSEPPEKLKYFLAHTRSPLTFQDCVVSYSGQPIPVVILKHGLKFIDCVFQVSGTAAPPEGKELLTTMLAARDLSDITFSAPQGE